jgi:hypothetical protein
MGADAGRINKSCAAEPVRPNRGSMSPFRLDGGDTIIRAAPRQIQAMSAGSNRPLGSPLERFRGQ